VEEGEGQEQVEVQESLEGVQGEAYDRSGEGAFL
jgi:hypothetical protein